MPLIIASHDSLPYIEPAPTASELAQITSLITSALASSSTSTPHPSLPTLLPSTFTPAMTLELSRVASGLPLENGVDLSRYDPSTFTPDSPSTSTPSTSALSAAYTSSTHLSTRLTNLSLLSSYGRNAWLLHNSQLEELLRQLEESLMALRTEAEVCNKERKGAQVDVRDEMGRLEVRWKKAVGRVLEVELATEGVRRDILERQRAGAR
ncbi:Pre-mRNA-splicing factor SPF27 [Tricharina praecox]|uniref:Pre-mRNA-splicing factor SPF27 n=1 Tax=Tricharina praecox TaxID=43433 RepID=UPI00222084DC|nr:Pre-mRNA-splicing factor SPF27 [Tricharina praecox]KAI5857944.1 Pre-mRNA-splicing factor SPF27 [Tricharina praecox]